MHTACVWSVKLPFAEYSVVKDLFVAASGLSASHRVAIHVTATIVVENTGLEPVTSWLQTRRSPS